jgi:hypothetical protein
MAKPSMVPVWPVIEVTKPQIWPLQHPKLQRIA